MRMRQPNIEMQQQMEAIYSENEHLTREIAILRDTIKVKFKRFSHLINFEINNNRGGRGIKLLLYPFY